MSRTSELESVVLGLVWLNGPCTPYVLRQHFLGSPTPGWSGSAGAIYPLVRRLEERGFLRSNTNKADGRGARHYTISAKGRKALLDWLAPSPEEGEFGLPADPLRTRLFFLEALSPAQLATFLEDVRAQLSRQVDLMNYELRRRKGTACRFEVLAARGALMMARARARWWAEVCEALEA